ncbi:MAG: hypothetical protein MJZ62_03260 [Bacteroidales bacterium]|nr:hypothetical protein [Bacteroidales bacterium]
MERIWRERGENVERMCLHKGRTKQKSPWQNDFLWRTATKKRIKNRPPFASYGSYQLLKNKDLESFFLPVQKICVLLQFQNLSKNEENISTITQKKSK